MASFIALLRGVNVGGNVLKMDRLAEIFTGMGCGNVRTYVQSGNVVFEAAARSPALTQFEQRLVKETRLPVAVILRTGEEIKRIIAENPFLDRSGVDPTKLHVTFLANMATKELLKNLDEINAVGDEFEANGKEIYIYCPNGYGRTKLSNNVIERKLSVKATTRNWNTVIRLHEMISQKI